MAVLALLLALTCTGCADPDGTASESSRLKANQWLRTTSEVQKAVLLDGEVTASEYAGSVEAARTCVEGLGFGVSAVRNVSDGVRQDFVVRPGDKTTEEAFDALAACRSEQLEAVESVYLAQHSRIDEGREVLEGELITCLQKHGVPDVPTGLTDFELFKLLRERDVSTDAWFCREIFLIATGNLGASPP